MLCAISSTLACNVSRSRAGDVAGRCVKRRSTLKSRPLHGTSSAPCSAIENTSGTYPAAAALLCDT
eukprot:3636472-Pleurochrysis_carterae.AAC.1